MRADIRLLTPCIEKMVEDSLGKTILICIVIL